MILSRKGLLSIGALFFCFPLFSASIVIDAGSAADTLCPPPNKYTVQSAADTTLCFGTFSYKIPVSPDGPYIVKLNFLEPSAAPPARAFSVTINDQIIYPRLTMPGYLVPFSRSTIVMSADGFLNIQFTTIIRSAVVSSIEVSPLPSGGSVLPVDGLPFRVLSEIPVSQPDGTWMLKGPNAGFSYVIYDVAVYVNGLRMQAGVDYTFAPDSGPDWQLRITPTSPWTGKVLADYTVYSPKPLPPIVRLLNCRGSGPGGNGIWPWDCHGISYAEINVGGLVTPFVLVPAPPDINLANFSQ